MTINHWLQYAIIITLLMSAISDSRASQYPERIIALSPHAVELLYAIGAGDKIIATIAHADYPDAAKNIPVIGDHKGIALEKLIRLQPDLVVVWPSGNQVNQINQIKRLGYNTLVSDPSTFEHIGADLRALGRVTGHPIKAEQVAQQFESQLDTLTQRYQQRSPIKTFYQLWSAPLMTVSQASWINQFISRCGGVNVFANANTPYPKVSIENVLLTDAQVILIPSAKQKNHNSFNWERWSLLPAVKNKHIYYPDATTLHRPTPRLLSSMNKVCQLINNAR